MRRALETHPDKCGSDSAFREVCKTYEVLVIVAVVQDTTSAVRLCRSPRQNCNCEVCMCKSPIQNCNSGVLRDPYHGSLLMLLPFTHVQIILFQFCLDHRLVRGGILFRLLFAVPTVVAGLLFLSDFIPWAPRIKWCCNN